MPTRHQPPGPSSRRPYALPGTPPPPAYARWPLSDFPLKYPAPRSMVWSESAYPAPPTRNRRAGRQAGRQAQGPPADPSREAPSARPIRDPAQVKPAYPRPRPAQQYQPALQATCPTPRSLPYTTAPPAGARPGPTGPGCCLLGFSQVSPAYPAPPRAQPLLRHSPPPPTHPRLRGNLHWGNRGEGRLTLSRS